MNFRPFDFLARPLALAGGLAIAALAAFSPPAVAQTNPGAGIASLSTGSSCAYTSITTFPNGGVAVTCSGVAISSATISLGTVSGSLVAGTATTATVPVSCAGTACNGVIVDIAITPAVSGLSIIPSTHTFTGAGSRTITVDGTPPATGASNATVVVTLNSKGTATTTDPANVGDTKSISIPIVSASEPGTLAFSPVSAAVTEGGAVQTVNVTRTGSGTSAPTVTVNYTCAALPSGYTPAITPAASGTLTWTGADAAAKPITINPTTVPASTAGSVTCTLSGPTGGATASTTAYVLTVNKASTGGGGTCTTTADVNVDFSTGTLYRANFSMTAQKTGAVKFKASRGLVQSDGSIITQNNVKLSYSAPIPGGTAPSYYQVNISECPGDFTTTLGPSCGPFNFSGPARTNYASVLTTGSSSYCKGLDPAKVYYYNIRYLKSDNSSGCSVGTCSNYVDMTPF